MKAQTLTPSHIRHRNTFQVELELKIEGKTKRLLENREIVL